MSISIKGKPLGQGEPCYIVFEAGPTHDGMRTAIELVKQAAAAGADAIKFQIMDPDRLVADKQQLFSYDILLDRESGKTQSISEPLYDILARRAMTQDEWREVKSVADQVGIAFFATVGFEEDIELVTEIGCDSIKIASADVNHFPLIKKAAQTGLCIQLDTGRSSIGEVESAVDAILSEGNQNIVIHQCPSGYPARLNSIHLRMITTLKQMFPEIPIAFSDHTPGWDMDIAAVTLGAAMVEKTITLNRTTPSVEHIFSLEGQELHKFIQAIRDLEAALGDTRRVLHPQEHRSRDSIRRSAFFTRDMNEGDVITESDIDFRRPGFGISPVNFDDILGATVTEEVAKGDMLAWHQMKPKSKD